WGIAPSDVTVSGGTVSGGGNTATLGELAEAAGAQPVPAEVTLKTPDQWVLIGKDTPRVELPLKARGSVGMFGIDYQPDGGLVAMMARPPQFGAAVVSVDDTAAKSMPGVIAVLPLPMGVAVVAENTWSAMQGRDALEIEWDIGTAETRSSDTLEAEYRALLDRDGIAAPSRGDTATKLASAEKTITADYYFPFLNHAQLEPLNITVFYDGTKAELTFGSQIQTLDHGAAAQVLGLEFPQITIRTTWAGGSFGRRATFDAHLTVEGCLVAKSFLDTTGEARPIKLVFTREDDMKAGYYRPVHMHRVEAGVDAEGKVSGWRHRIVGQSLFKGTPFEDFVINDGVDGTMVEGTVDTAYDLPDYALDVHHPDVGVPVLWWRSVGHTHTAYVMETMIDELAEAAGADPVAFRMGLLGNASREAGVLKLAAEKAGWDQPAPEGIFRGVAVHKSFDSYVAEVAEVSMRDDGTVKVERVVCAVDCGIAINPDNVRAQMEGGIGYGLSALLREEITMTDGEVDQWNYPDYLALRNSDMPKVEVHILASAEAPTGVGEPGLPPVGPAVANAVY
ncbi:MAG: molybdopterin cofactor-binding domain-containing protein, partial [Pseudomonadota bacterium]